MENRLVIVFLFCLAASLGFADGGSVLYFDIEDAYNSHEHFAAAVIQGLLNRDHPRAFLNTGKKHWCVGMHDDYTSISKNDLEKYRGSDDYFVEYYSKRHKFVFERVHTLDEFARKSGAVIKGVVVYAPDEPANYLLAATIASCCDAVPVTKETLETSPFLAGLPVVEDLCGRFKDYFAAQLWAYEKYFKDCSKEAVFSKKGGHSFIVDVDLGVAQECFFFDLDYMKTRNPDQVELLDMILSQLKPASPVYGWGTSEKTMLARMAQHGVILMCTDSLNLSFHRQVKPLKISFKLPKRKKLQLGNKYYVTITGNEGDTLKQVASLQRSAWFNPQRGKVPFNWGMSSWINDHYPALAELYYDQATTNDHFASIIGYGFYNPKYHREMDLLCSLEKKSNRRFEMVGGDMYSSLGSYDATSGFLDKRTDDWLVKRGLEGYFFECSQGEYLKFTSAGQPVIGMDWKLFYWWHRFPGANVREKVEASVDHIMEIAKLHEPPYFFPIYGGTPESAMIFQETFAKKDSRFEMVTLDQMIDLAKQARKLGTVNEDIKESHYAKKPKENPPTVSKAIRKKVAYATVTLDGKAFEWANVKSDKITLHSSVTHGCNIAAEVRLAWDKEFLYILVEELSGDDIACESVMPMEYETSEHSNSDSVVLWFDFANNGQAKVTGGYTLWLGFSSKGIGDLYVCYFNDMDLSSKYPLTEIKTSGELGSRVIEAVIKWRDINRFVYERFKPDLGLSDVREGMVFGCEPALIDGEIRYDGQYSRKTWKNGKHKEVPSGFDEDSIDLILIK